MDAGRAIEFDEAHILLENEHGIFNGMVKALGQLEYERLAEAAQQKFDTKHDVQFYQTYL